MMDTNFIVIILETIGLFCLIVFGAYLIAPRKSKQKEHKNCCDTAIDKGTLVYKGRANRWRAVLYTKDKKSDLYTIDAFVSSPNRMDAISTITQYAYTMTDDKSEDIKIIIRPGKAGEDNITE